MKYKTIKISSKWLRHLFTCDIEYITTTCKGRCCRGTDKIMVSVLPEEEIIQRENGFNVIDGLLQPDPDTKMCPHQLSTGLCNAHNTELKPFGCIASPFTLNNNDTLIIRHRYSKFKCHGHGDPAYKTFRASLDLIFGDVISQNICDRLDHNSKDFYVKIPEENYLKLKYLDNIKKKRNVDDKTKTSKLSDFY